MKKVKLILDQYIDSKNITRYQLSADTGIRYDTIDKYYKNKLQRYDSYILTKFCEVLNCNIADIIKYGD